MRRRVAGVSIALSVVLTVASCGSDGDSEDSRPSSSASTSPAEGGESAAEPQSSALDTIDVAGADGSPIDWQLPEDASPTGPEAVAQRYFAIIRQAGTPGADVSEALVRSVTDDDYAAVPIVRLQEAKAAGDKTSGPQWIWIDAAREDGDRAFVKGCADVGYFQPAGTDTPVDDRAVALYAELKRVDDADGAQVWKVSRYNAGPTDDADPFEKQCPAWATHTP